MRRITVAMIEAGGGHKSPALSIAAGISEASPDTHVEVLDFHKAVWALDFDAEHKRTWSNMLKSPVLTQVGSQLLSLSGSTARNYTVYWSREAIGKGAAWILEQKPDLFFSTHYLNIPPALEARRIAIENDIHLPTRIVLFAAEVFRLNPLWIWKDVDEFIVASPQALEHAVELGMPRERIRLFPYPVKPEFSETPVPERPSTEAQPPEKLRVLISSGAEGRGKIERILDEMVRADLPVRAQVICGKNQDFYQRLRSMDLRGKNIELQPLGFVSNMPELMSENDVLITKAGPATSFEALHRRLPIVYFDAVSQSEMANVEYCRAHGFGWYKPFIPSLLSLLADLTQNPGILQEARNRITGEGHKNGYLDIARFLLSRDPVDIHAIEEPWRPIWAKPNKKLKTRLVPARQSAARQS